MAVSGSTNFELDVTEYIEEAFERCGLEVRTGYDLKTAKRSLNIMLAEWATNIIDVLSVSLLRGSVYYALERISRDTYLSIPNKSATGRPTQFFLDRQINPNLKIWPLPENSTDVLYYDALTRIDDLDTFTNTLDIPFRFYPCLAAGLAYYIAIKRAPDRIQMLKAVYEEEFQRAIAEDRDRASVTISPALGDYRIV